MPGVRMPPLPTGRAVGLALGPVLGIGLLNFALLALAPWARVDDWAVPAPADLWRLAGIAAIWVGCGAGAVWVAQRYLPGHDPHLLPMVYWLSGWGLALIWRVAPAFAVRQALWLVVGTLALLAVALWGGDWRWFKRYRYTALALGLALTALTLVIGVNPEGRGAALWLGGWFDVFVQPAEVLKLVLVAFLAAYLADRREQIFGAHGPVPAYFVPLMAVWVFSVLILIGQRDLGMSTLFFLTFLVMLYLASGQALYLVAGGGLLVSAALVGFALFEVVRVRVAIWLDPWADPLGRSFQVVQGLLALAAGGLMGRGPGLGAPTLVPVSHSDYVLAVLAEEWGWLGVLGALTGLAWLSVRGWLVALARPEPFQQLLAAGFTTVFSLQSLLILGGVLRVLPLTGLTLPLLSYGGTSLVTTLMVFGVLLRLSVPK